MRWHVVCYESFVCFGLFRCKSFVNRLIVPHQKQLPWQDEDDVARRDLGHEGAVESYFSAVVL